MNARSKFSLLALAALSCYAHAQTQDAGDAGAGAGANNVAAAPTEAANAPQEVPVPEGMKAEVFHFRKEKVKDDAGNEIGETFKHPSVKIPLPVPTREEILAIFQAPSTGDGNRATEQKFVCDLVYDALYKQVRDQINEYREANPKGTVSAQIVDYSKVSLTALANMPPSERGSKLDEEDLKDFLADYVVVMPAATNRDATKIKAQAGILEKGLRTVKTDKKVLSVMKDLLSVWAAHTQNLEEHQEVYDYLMGRAERWLKAEPKNVLDSIM